MTKYSKKAQAKVQKAMHEFKRGKLEHAKTRKQAIAIGLSQARKEGTKVPPR